MKSWRAVIGVVLLFGGTAAEAGQPYYFHKAGVSRDAYAADVGECAELAGGIKVHAQYLYAPNLYAAAAGALFSGMAAGAERRRLEDKVERTCMADKGYHRLAADKDMLGSLHGLDAKARLDRLFQLAASEAPAGTEMAE